MAQILSIPQLASAKLRKIQFMVFPTTAQLDVTETPMLARGVKLFFALIHLE